MSRGIHRRTNPAVVVVSIALVLIALLMLIATIGLSMLGDSGARTDAPEASPVGAPSTPLSAPEQCVVETMALLSRTQQAIQEGYDGLDMNEVASRYGTESATFRAFAYTQTDFVGDVIQHGSDGALTRIQPEVRTRCQELT